VKEEPKIIVVEPPLKEPSVHQSVELKASLNKKLSESIISGKASSMHKGRNKSGAIHRTIGSLGGAPFIPVY